MICKNLIKYWIWYIYIYMTRKKQNLKENRELTHPYEP